MHRHVISNIGTCDRSVDFSRYSNFLQQYNWLPRYSWNIVQRGVKHHKHDLLLAFFTVQMYRHKKSNIDVFGSFQLYEHKRLYIGIFTIGNCLLNLIPYLFYDDFRQPMATSGFPQIVYLYGRLYRYDSDYWLCFV